MFKFRSYRKKEKQKELLKNEQEILMKEKEIERIKLRSQKKAYEAARAMKKLNEEVQAHGVNGILYYAMGGQKDER